MVPVSCPPWPGSITILPIFNPKARIRERSPLAVGEASRTSGKITADWRLFRLELRESVGKFNAVGGSVTGGLAAGLISGGSSLATVTALSSSSSASTTVFLVPLLVATGNGLSVGLWGCALASAAGVTGSFTGVPRTAFLL